MAIMSTGSFPQDLRPGIRFWSGLEYEIYEQEYDKLFDVKTVSERAYEEDVYASGVGLATVKPQGSPVTYDAGQQEYTTRYNHIQYGLGFVVTEEMIEDGIALKKAEIFTRNLTKSMLRTREIVAANVYNNAFTSTAKMDGGDGVCLASNAHPTRSGNQSNIPTTLVDLSEAGLEQAVIDVQAFKNSRGLLIQTRPTALIIPPALQFTAERILSSPLRSGTTNNDVNALRQRGAIPEVHVNHYLTTSASAWFVRTDEPGLNFFNRKDITIDRDNDFDTNNLKIKGLMRISAGWTDFRSIYAVNGP